jgi:hypothetical protein
MANSVGDAECSLSDLRLVRGGQFDRVLGGEPAADMRSGIVGARPFSAQGFAVLNGDLR